MQTIFLEYFYPIFIISHIILLGLSLVYFNLKYNFFWILVFGVVFFIIESVFSYFAFFVFGVQVKYLLLWVNIIFLLLHVSKWQVLKKYILNNRIQVASHITILVISSCIAWMLTFLPIAKPAELRDGPYVWKNWSLPVQMQRIALDYPPDNALPAVVGEFLVQQISFKDVAPILPGQAVGNRTFLMSFPYVASRISFTDVQRKTVSINQFQYVGTSWPDTLSLITDKNFRLYLGTTIPLNLLILNLVIWYYFRYVYPKKFGLKILLFIVTVSLTPIAIFNSVFSWPKNFASFFIAITSYFLVINKSIKASFFWCLAYLVHPLALPFLAIPIILPLLRHKHYKIRDIISFYYVPLATIFAWFYWVKLVINSEFDLIGQNSKSSQSLAGQLWVRVYNLNVLTFGNFLDQVPFSSISFLLAYLASLASLFGLASFLLIYFFRDLVQIIRSNTEFMTNLVFGLLITMLFSYPIASINHGWQSFWPALIAAFLIVISKKSRLVQYLGTTAIILSHLVVYSLWINEVV